MMFQPILLEGGIKLSTLTEIIAAMTEIFKFFITLFSDLFKTITETPIMWVPLAIALLFTLVWKVPKLVRRLRKI